MKNKLETFPFNWFPQRVGTHGTYMLRVQMVEFPFNWFPQRVGTGQVSSVPYGSNEVSIQLVSPASGDKNFAGDKR